ncbi:hypothetical protein P0D73_24060, partial [Paraburkholderia sp. RL18-101-BIB-B]|uniref:hypothetical protein n=1 Tax=Paraburkholderia sp. RL18-101-BIB-B TaxID=3031634 RepID=UPI0038BCB9C9
MFKDSAARVKLLVSTIRMNVRIAVILSITVHAPVEGLGFCLAIAVACAADCGFFCVGLSLES